MSGDLVPSGAVQGEIVTLSATPAPRIPDTRTIYSDDERPVEVSILIKGAHLYELEYREFIENQA